MSKITLNYSKVKDGYIFRKRQNKEHYKIKIYSKLLIYKEIQTVN